MTQVNDDIGSSASCPSTVVAQHSRAPAQETHEICFPDADSQRVRVFAENGSVRLARASVRHLGSYRD